jgi:hypothetical protein
MYKFGDRVIETTQQTKAPKCDWYEDRLSRSSDMKQDTTW